MAVQFDKEDFYFKQAKKDWYVARSAYKLEEIDKKFNFFNTKTKTVIDIGCAPWSWTQYTHKILQKTKKKDFFDTKIVWFDLKSTDINLSWVHTFKQDITETDKVKEILKNLNITKLDAIISDMAPDTIWNSWADAIRSIWLIESTLRIYYELLKPEWKFAIKVFMWPWFQELYNYLRDNFGWAKRVKIFKPKACRKKSKETYIVRV